MLSMVTGHGGATPLLWKTVASSLTTELAFEYVIRLRGDIYVTNARGERPPRGSPSRARRTSAASRPSSCPPRRWEQVRDAFWARTGFPVDPDAAVEQAESSPVGCVRPFPGRCRLTTGRSRSTTMGGGSRRTRPSSRLAELHRWLDARNRTIRLADLLIEVENDLGFSVHFQQPGERVDPGEVCALLAAILAHGCNLGLYTMEKVAPDIAYRRLKNVSDWRLVEENQRAALAAIVHGIALHRHARLHRDQRQRLRPRVLLLRRRQLRPVLQPSGRVHRRRVRHGRHAVLP